MCSVNIARSAVIVSVIIKTWYQCLYYMYTYHSVNKILNRGLCMYIMFTLVSHHVYSWSHGSCQHCRFEVMIIYKSHGSDITSILLTKQLKR